MAPRKIAFGLLDLVLAMATVGAVAIALLSFAGPALGVHAVVLEGGSMEPALPIGSLVLSRATDPNEIGVGDIVTYRRPNGTIVTHRVVDVSGLGDGRSFFVRGDANPTPDAAPVPASALVGRSLLGLPYLGTALLLGREPWAFPSLLGVLLLAWLLPGVRLGRPG